MPEQVKLYGRIFLTMDIRAVTGLRIGGSPAALNIGALDNVVIRDPLTQRPYIPGSSLRGKLRSLWEKATNAEQNFYVRRGNPTVRLHTLADGAALNDDPVCRIFGVTGDTAVPNPTRLIVHDTFMSEESVKALEESTLTDQPYTETKWEATIDRITSAAVPRQMERVPADTVFGPARLVYSIYGTPDTPAAPFGDVVWFFDIIQMLLLLEDDYLGSSGSRGSGQIVFENLQLSMRVTGAYGSNRYMEPIHILDKTTNQPIVFRTVEELWTDYEALRDIFLSYLTS